MRRYFLQRLAVFLPILWGVVTLVFLLIHMIPGDPVEMMLGENALPGQRTELRKQLRLDEPIGQQYVRYVWNAIHLDFGTSIYSGESVASRITSRFPNTILLSLSAIWVALFLSIPSGLLAGVWQGGKWDTIVMGASLIGLSIPAFWLGPLLILIFSVYLDWFPISGTSGALSLALPALTLGTGMSAILARMTRGSVIDLLREDFVRTARAKGLSFWKIFFKHVLKNALLPVVTILGLQVGALLSGSIITEKVFSWPGIGLELIEAIEKRDYPLVQGIVLVIALSYVSINLLTDLAYAWLDPRIRFQRPQA